jgi:hypothetical protein
MSMNAVASYFAEEGQQAAGQAQHGEDEERRNEARRIQSGLGANKECGDDDADGKGGHGAENDRPMSAVGSAHERCTFCGANGQLLLIGRVAG